MKKKTLKKHVSPSIEGKVIRNSDIYRQIAVNVVRKIRGIVSYGVNNGILRVVIADTMRHDIDKFIYKAYVCDNDDNVSNAVKDINCTLKELGYR
jgi:hypothetical protein